MDFLYGINLIGSALFWAVLLIVAGASAALARRVWVGGLVSGILLLLAVHPWRIMHAPMLLVVFVLVGLAAGVCGWSLRLRRLRLAALGGLWCGAVLALLYLYSLSERPHGTSDLVFAGGLLVSILVVGSLTVVSLPPDEVPSRLRPPAA